MMRQTTINIFLCSNKNMFQTLTKTERMLINRNWSESSQVLISHCNNQFMTKNWWSFRWASLCYHLQVWKITIVKCLTVFLTLFRAILPQKNKNYKKRYQLKLNKNYLKKKSRKSLIKLTISKPKTSMSWSTNQKLIQSLK